MRGRGFTRPLFAGRSVPLSGFPDLREDGMHQGNGQDTERIFAFESGYSADLHFLPMAMRYRLDLAGIKIGLKAWMGIPVRDRFALAAYPIAPGDGAAGFAEEAARVLCANARERPESIPKADPKAWGISIPPPVRLACEIAGIPMEADAWKRLGELQRYALLKLSDSRRDPEAFGRAWREFAGGVP